MANEDRNNAILREMQRTSLDLIRIYNPTDKDFVILWDGFKHIVPSKNKDIGYGKGQRVVQRYLAMWYLKHMTDQIITEAQDNKLKDIRKKYEDAGMEDALLKANLEVERNREMRTDNETEVKRIAEIIWLGIEEKYGMDMQEETKQGNIDQRPIHEQIADTMKEKVYRKPVEESVFPINKKKKLIEEVSQ
jgi:hypothetical protein